MADVSKRRRQSSYGILDTAPEAIPLTLPPFYTDPTLVELGIAMQTRIAPPTDAPPPYTRVIRRVYRGSLRPVVIVISLLGLVWAAAVGVSNLQDVGDEGGKPLRVTFRSKRTPF
jgi:hypothetical protein